MANIKRSGGRVKQMTQQSKRFIGLPNNDSITREMIQNNTISSDKLKQGDSVLIGEIKQISTLPNTPVPDGHWQELDGSVVSDPASPYNGIRIYNLNGASVELALSWTAGVATVADADINALNIGDSFTGAGISNVNGQPPIITNISGNTVTTNSSFTGTVDTTFTNNGIYLGGGSSNTSATDAMQAHFHDLSTKAGGGSAFGGVGAGVNSTTTFVDSYTYASNAKTDATNGTPRTATRTRPHTRFVKMIMRIK